MNPLEPRPGDWEAALKAIEEAEVRHDRAVRWRKRGKLGGAVVVLFLAFWGVYNVLVGEEAAPKQVAQVEAVGSDASEVIGEATAPSAVEPAEWSAPAVLEEGSDLGNEESAFNNSDDVKATTGEFTEREIDEVPAGERRTMELSEVSAGEHLAIESGGVPAEERQTMEPSEEVEASSDVRELIRLEPGLIEQSMKGTLMPVDLQPSDENVERRWSLFLGREQAAWVAGVAAQFGGERMPTLRLGTVWDQRNHQWVAHPQEGVFGPKPARGIASEEAHWAVAGMDWKGHLKGRWGWVVGCEGQFLIARLMTPSTYVQSESLAPSGPEVWGTLEEERRGRFRWSVGTEWAATGRHAVRFALGGYVHPEWQLDYMNFTSGAPRTVGEFRATWFWK